MNNDANAAVLAEWIYGAAKGVSDLVYLTASTGMGGGIIMNGKLLQGITDTAGEVGHFVLDINGPACPCGKKGCFEIYCGGGNLAKRMQEQIVKDEIETKVLEAAGGDPKKIDMIALIEGVKQKDPYALSMWEEFVERLAQGLGIIIQTLNPQAIVLGTIAIHTGSLLMDPLKKALPRYCWAQPLNACSIEASILGDGISELSALALAICGLKNT